MNAQDLIGRYEPNIPGARTIAEAKPLYLGKDKTERVEAHIYTHPETKEIELFIFIGSRKAYQGPIPAQITGRHDVNRVVAQIAIDVDAASRQPKPAGRVMPTRRVTYLGSRCDVKEIRQAGANGEREFRMRWVDAADPRNGGYPAGTITSKTVTGNALKGTLATLIDTHIVEEF